MTTGICSEWTKRVGKQICCNVLEKYFLIDHIGEETSPFVSSSIFGWSNNSTDIRQINRRKKIVFIYTGAHKNMRLQGVTKAGGFYTSWKWKCWSLSRVRLLVTPGTVACQAPLSMVFSRQEYWSGLPFPCPGEHPGLGITVLQHSGRFFTIWEGKH